MDKTFLRSVAVGALAAAIPAFAALSPALAADMAVKALPPPAPIYTWTGFYVGGNVGYSWGTADSTLNMPGFANGLGSWSNPPTSFKDSQSLNGLIGGGQLGYNWLTANNVVFGLEADFQGSAEKNTKYVCDFEGIFCLNETRDARIHWFGTVRGRLGVAVNPAVLPALLYVTGGLAYGKVSFNGTMVDDPANTGIAFAYGDSKIKVGYAVGAGVEAAIMNSKNWTWRVEYLYIDLGSLSGSGIEPFTGNAYNWNAKFTDNIVRVGINYRFQP